jgi:hypothetical protein
MEDMLDVRVQNVNHHQGCGGYYVRVIARVGFVFKEPACNAQNSHDQQELCRSRKISVYVVRNVTCLGEMVIVHAENVHDCVVEINHVQCVDERGMILLYSPERAAY